MFGIGFGEFTVVLIVLLIAVGPDRMPALMRAVGKGLRQFRSAARELREATGIDEIMREENLREFDELRKLKGKRVGDVVRGELGKPGAFVRDEIQRPLDDAMRATGGSAVAPKKESRRAGGRLTDEQLAAEQPPEGVDIAHAAASVRSGELEA